MANKTYRISDVQGMNRIDSKWNMSAQWMYDLKNGYLERSPSERTLIKQRWGLRKLTTTSKVDSSGFALEAYPWAYSLFKAPNDAGPDGFGSDPILSQFNTLSDAGVLSFDLSDPNADWVEIGSLSATSIPFHAKPFENYNGQAVHLPSNQIITAETNSGPFCADTTHFNGAGGGKIHYRRLILNVYQSLSISSSGDPVSTTAFSRAMDSASLTNTGFLPEGQFFYNLFSLNKNALLICMKEAVVSYNLADVISESQIVDFKHFRSVTPNGFVQVAGDLYGMAYDGFKRISSIDQSQPTSIIDPTFKIREYYKDLVKWNKRPFINAISFHNGNNLFETNPGYGVLGAYYPCMAFFVPKQNQIWLSIPQNPNGREIFGGSSDSDYLISNFDFGTNENQVLIFSLEFNEFVGRFVFPEIITGAALDNNQDLYLTMSDGHLYKYDESYYTDGGTAIEFSYKPGYVGNESQRNYKAFDRLSMVADSNATGPLSITYNPAPISGNEAEQVGSSATETVDLVNGTGAVVERDLLGRGKALDIELHHAVSGMRVTLTDVQLEVNLEGEI